MVGISNKYGEIPLDKCKGQMSQKLLGMNKFTQLAKYISVT